MSISPSKYPSSFSTAQYLPGEIRKNTQHSQNIMNINRGQLSVETKNKHLLQHSYNSFIHEGKLQTQDKLLHEQFQYFSNELELLKDRIQAKALKQEKEIDGLYLELKEIEKQFFIQQKQLLETQTAHQKQILKNLDEKTKKSFRELRENAQNIHEKLKKQKAVISTNLDKFEQNNFKKEVKGRQQEWEGQIDYLSRLMISVEGQLHQMREESGQKLKNLEHELWRIQNQTVLELHEQKRETQAEHDTILHLINKTAEQLRLL